MKTTYAAKANAAYIYVTAKHGSITETAELSEDILVDYDKEGRPVGVEILNAKNILPKKVFQYLKDNQIQPI